MFIGELLLVSPPLIYIWLKKFDLRETLRIKQVPHSLYLISAFIGISATILSSEIDAYLIPLFPKNGLFQWFQEMMNHLPEMMKIKTVSDGILLFFATVVVAAVLEELLFRGFLQKALENNNGAIFAIFVSSLLFSIVHGNVLWGIQIFLIGILLGWVAWKSNSIFPGMIIHGTNNGIAIIFMNLSVNPVQPDLPPDHLPNGIVFISLILFLFSIYYFQKISAKPE
jgi:membrane protease YdiL (CAAX protease family)